MLFNLPYVSLVDLRGMKVTVSNPQRQHLEIGVSSSVLSWLPKNGYGKGFVIYFPDHLYCILKVVQWE